jgi:hypothetical protein
MLRLLAAMCLSATGFVWAEDLPADITSKAREKWIKEWQSAYAKERDKLTKKIDDAKTKMKFAATAKEGREELASAQKALDTLKQEPWRFGFTPFVVITDKPTEKTVGWVASGNYTATATEKGTVVEGVITVTPLKGTPEKRVARFFIASPLKIAKDKKNAPLALSGLWYVAGSTAVNGRMMPVLYRFEIKKEDFPPEKK